MSSSKIPRSNMFQKLMMYRENPCSLKPTSSSSMKPALQNQKIRSSVVIRLDLWMRTAKNKPINMASEHVERNWRYRGTLNLDSLKSDAFLGSYSATDRRPGGTPYRRPCSSLIC